MGSCKGRSDFTVFVFKRRAHHNLQATLRRPLRCTLTAAVRGEVRGERRGGWQAGTVPVEGNVPSSRWDQVRGLGSRRERILEPAGVKAKQVYLETHTLQAECGCLRKWEPPRYGAMSWAAFYGLISQPGGWEEYACYSGYRGGFSRIGPLPAIWPFMVLLGTVRSKGSDF